MRAQRDGELGMTIALEDSTILHWYSVADFNLCFAFVLLLLSRFGYFRLNLHRLLNLFKANICCSQTNQDRGHRCSHCGRLPTESIVQ